MDVTGLTPRIGEEKVENNSYWASAAGEFTVNMSGWIIFNEFQNALSSDGIIQHWELWNIRPTSERESIKHHQDDYFTDFIVLTIHPSISSNSLTLCQTLPFCFPPTERQKETFYWIHFYNRPVCSALFITGLPGGHVIRMIYFNMTEIYPEALIVLITWK